MKSKKVIISIGAICIIGIMVAVAFSVNKNKGIIEVSSPNIGVSEAFTEPIEEAEPVKTEPVIETVEETTEAEEEPTVEETPAVETKPVVEEEPVAETKPVVKEETPKQDTPQAPQNTNKVIYAEDVFGDVPEQTPGGANPNTDLGNLE